MCLIVLAYRQHPVYPLIFASNRDELYARPTAPAAFWDEAPHVLAGRDLEAGGTWLGVTRAGRFCAITNFRDRADHDPDAPSRGEIVADYLRGRTSPAAYLEALAARAGVYNGFNLLVGDSRRLFYYSNRGDEVRELAPGLYGLSNHLLETPWPKVVLAKQALAGLLSLPVLDPEPVFGLLADETRAIDEALPDTGVGLEWERILSSVFIKGPTYGTRASTVFWIDREGRLTFLERTFDAASGEARTERFAFRIEDETN